MRKPEFLTQLDVTCAYPLAYGGRGIWHINAPLVYYSAILGRVITVEVGFYTDFASTPRCPGIYWLFGDTGKYESVIHDWLFHHHEICDEQTANLVLLEAAKAIGTPKWTRVGMYLGVKFGGESSWEEDGKGFGHTVVNGRVV